MRTRPHLRRPRNLLVPLGALVIASAVGGAFAPAARGSDFYEALGRAPRSFYEQNVDLAENQTDRIEQHLLFMVDYLAAASADHLTAVQRAERARNIERLADYARERRFPQNPCAGMTPIFIDQQQTACAVGHLMIESGASDVAHQIAATQNLRYLGDIDVPGVEAWIERSGLTARECAMIQPAYAGDFIESFEAESIGDDILVTWDLGDQPVDWVILTRTGGSGPQVDYWLEEDDREFLDVGLEPGDYTYSLYVEELFVIYDTAELTHAHHTWTFLRGDANGDGTVDGVADTIYILQYAFVGGPPPPCMEAADTDGNGQMEPLSDALYVMYYALASGPPPAAPFPACAPDPATSTSLGCVLPACP